MSLPTPQEVRHMYIDKGAKPSQYTFGVSIWGNTFISSCEGFCCAIGVCLLGSHTPTEEDGYYSSFAKMYGIPENTVDSFAKGFDADNEYWEAVKDLA